MTRAALDSNILIYAVLEPQTVKGQRARDAIQLSAARGIIAWQALLEFVAVVRRRASTLTSQAIDQAQAWAAVFETAPTTHLVVRDALMLVHRHQFQAWDAVICAAVSATGADVFLSEDLQDGLRIFDMYVVNPFVRADEDLRTLLAA